MKMFAWALTFIFMTSFHAQAGADESLYALDGAKKMISSLPDMRVYKVKGDNDPVLKSTASINRSLNQAVTEYLKEPEDQRLLEEIVLTASEYNKKDGYQPGSVALIPIYKKAYNQKKPNKDLQTSFEKAVGKLSPTDAKQLLKSTQNQYRYSEEGG